MLEVTPELDEELSILTDRNIFEFWKEEILILYKTGRKDPHYGNLKRALQRSELVDGGKNQYTWSERGLALIEAELRSRGIFVERHKALRWR